MLRIHMALAGLLCMLPAVQAGELFRWVDDHGVVHYSDSPPANTPGVERKSMITSTATGDDLPYETRKAQQDFPVTLYVGKGCGETCNQARDLLNKRGIPYSEKTLALKEDVENFKKLSGIDGIVPDLAVGNYYLKGFLAEQWQSELDIAGYPRNAGYRQPPPIAPMQSTQPAEGEAPVSGVVPADTASQ